MFNSNNVKFIFEIFHDVFDLRITEVSKLLELKAIFDLNVLFLSFLFLFWTILISWNFKLVNTSAKMDIVIFDLDLILGIMWRSLEFIVFKVIKKLSFDDIWMPVCNKIGFIRACSDKKV